MGDRVNSEQERLLRLVANAVIDSGRLLLGSYDEGELRMQFERAFPNAERESCPAAEGSRPHCFCSYTRNGLSVCCFCERTQADLDVHGNDPCGSARCKADHG